MIQINKLRMTFGERILFEDVNVKFTPGNCYGVIGANGAGKSTFLNIVSGDQSYDSGEIVIPKGERLGVLRQHRDAYNDLTLIEAVICGHERLYEVMTEKDALYAKEDFTDEDGMRASELEGEFAELNGWEAESEATTLLKGLGVEEELHNSKMKDIDETFKVRVLIAQALFGNPDNLLLDEPTNHLDIESIQWLEDFLYNFHNTVIVVSHDRHFLNRVCTHIADIDYGRISIYLGNYAFWQQASQLAAKQKKDDRKKAEERAVELKAFIQRFSANASKSKQATARRKELEKMDLNDLPTSSRRFPYVAFKPEREVGKIVFESEGITASVEGEPLIKDLDFMMRPGEKISLVGPLSQHKTLLMDIVAGVTKPDGGTFRRGETTTFSYFPKDNSHFFETDTNMTDWLRQFSEEQDESFIRGFLGRMLFSGDDSLKPVNVLSGGERVRCLLARMMLSGANVLVMDDPTAHLDLEAITSLNNGLMDFTGVLLFTSHDHQFINTIANRIIEFTPAGLIDRRMTFDEYIDDPGVKNQRDKHYGGKHERITI